MWNSTGIDLMGAWMYEPVQLSRNKIEINIAAADPLITVRAGLRYFCEVWIAASMLRQAQQPNSVDEFEKIAVLEGSEVPPYVRFGETFFEGAYFDVSAYLDTLLEVSKPVFGRDEIGLCEDLVKRYYLVKVVKNGDVELSRETMPVKYILKGGINELDALSWEDKILTEPSGLAGKFLSWKPNESVIDAVADDSLYFLTNGLVLPIVYNEYEGLDDEGLPVLEMPPYLHLRMKVYFANETTEIKTVMSLSKPLKNMVYEFPVGPAVLGILSDAREVLAYEVWVSEQNMKRMSEVRRYVINRRYNRHERTIKFLNSLGGFDAYTFVGDGSEILKVKRDESKRYIPFLNEGMFSERIVNRVTGERELEVATGLMHNDELRYFDELLLSKEIFLQTESGFVPLLMQTAELVDSEDSLGPKGRIFVFRYGNEQNNYSRLPIAPANVVRAIGWRGFGVPVCFQNANGLFFGFGRFPKLEKIYLGTNEVVIPRTVKPNIEGTVGYIASSPVVACGIGNTPFVNVRQTKTSTYAKNNCLGFNMEGQKMELVIEAGTWGSIVSQAEADARALVALNSIDTQAYVNEHGTCRQMIWAGIGTPICLADEFGIWTGLGFFEQIQLFYADDNSPVMPIEITNNVILTEIDLNPANNPPFVLPTEMAMCAVTPYRNVAINRAIDFVNQNCAAPMVGSAVIVSIPQYRYGSAISQMDADNRAEAEWQVYNAQWYADLNGRCEIRTYEAGLRTSFWNYALNGPSTATKGFETLKHTEILENVNFADINAAGTYATAKQNGWSATYATIKYEGVIEIATAGNYDFKANFDDGIVLKINGVVVIDHYYYGSGYGTNVYGTAVNLPAGKVTFELEYFNAGGFGGLNLQWKQAGASVYAAIANGALSHVV